MSENFVQSFQLESSNIRGRIVRLDQVLDDILTPHDYPDDVQHLTGEIMTLCVMLSSMLKYDGIFTLQTKSDGAVNMLVADMVSNGNIRACASFKQEELDVATFKKDRAELMGTGYMAFTVDQGEHAERYQGIVELKSTSLITSVQHYFAQSEQINTGMVLAVGKRHGKWRASGIMVQEMPEETSKYNQDSVANDNEDDWRRTMVLLGSMKDDELLDVNLKAEDLLIRLFHEEGVRVFDALPLQNVCRCNADRVEAVLATMSEEDLVEMTVDGEIVMTCEFCSRDYKFDPKNLKGKTE